jgi:hypothetical protein
MSRIEEALVRRWGGVKLMKASALLGVAGSAPLLLYVLLGPKDGNPIGLGLLAVFTLPVAVVGLAVGAVAAVVQHRRSRGH